MIPSHSASHGTVSEPALSELVVVAYGKRDDTHHVTWADAFTHIQHANSMLARAAPAYYTHTHALLTLGPGKLHLCRSLDGPLPTIPSEPHMPRPHNLLTASAGTSE